MITFDNVTKKFGEITALDRVSFGIKDKEFVFITGPSGAGKTTIIRLIRREYLPTSGTIRVDSRQLDKLSKKELLQLRRSVGVALQNLKLLFDRTVYENVAISLKVLGKKEEVIEKEVKEVLELVGLSDRAHLFPAQLAGGELQRTCLAQAVVAQPKVIIADEPTGNLDPATGWQIVKLLKKIHQSGRTVIMATHNSEIVNATKARVISFDKGKLVSDKKKGKYQVING